MEPEIIEAWYYEVETSHGTEYVPDDVCDPDELDRFVEGEIYEFVHKHGWLARLSMPGYLDCTEWAAFPTRAEAVEYLSEEA